jgi:hypothetical protein
VVDVDGGRRGKGMGEAEVAEALVFVEVCREAGFECVW